MTPDTERIGIYGGTFSPIHMGHVSAAIAFLSEMKLDRLYIIPTAIPPHKAAVEGANGDDRLNMAKLAFDEYGSDIIRISDFEIKRAGKSYTVFTLEHFMKPGRELLLLVGTDMFLTLAEWFNAPEIFRLAHIVLVRRERERETTAKIERMKRIYAENYSAKISEINAEPLEISSTELREKLRAGESVKGLIPDGAAKYIKDNGLYL